VQDIRTRTAIHITVFHLGVGNDRVAPRLFMMLPTTTRMRICTGCVLSCRLRPITEGTRKYVRQLPAQGDDGLGTQTGIGEPHHGNAAARVPRARASRPRDAWLCDKAHGGGGACARATGARTHGWRSSGGGVARRRCCPLRRRRRGPHLAWPPPRSPKGHAVAPLPRRLAVL
jgi:hypothetical protein